jgi:hypothetical protein
MNIHGSLPELKQITGQKGRFRYWLPNARPHTTCGLSDHHKSIGSLPQIHQDILAKLPSKVRFTDNQLIRALLKINFHIQIIAKIQVKYNKRICPGRF